MNLHLYKRVGGCQQGLWDFRKKISVITYHLNTTKNKAFVAYHNTVSIIQWPFQIRFNPVQMNSWVNHGGYLKYRKTQVKLGGVKLFGQINRLIIYNENLVNRKRIEYSKRELQIFCRNLASICKIMMSLNP